MISYVHSQVSFPVLQIYSTFLYVFFNNCFIFVQFHGKEEKNPRCTMWYELFCVEYIQKYDAGEL